MLSYVRLLVGFLFADMMHDFTIHKELGQLPIRISLAQGRRCSISLREAKFMTIILPNKFKMTNRNDFSFLKLYKRAYVHT